MNRISIKLKVSLWYTLIIAVISVTTLAAVLSVSQRILINDSKEKIVRSVDDMANPREQKPFKEKAPPKPDGDRHDFGAMPPFRFFDNGVHTAVYDNERRLIGGSLPFEFADKIEFADYDLREMTYGGERFLTYVRRGGGDDVWIVGIVSIADESSMLQSVATTNLILIIIMILVAGVGGYFIIHRSFKPVDKIRKTAKEISESSDLSQRIALGEGRDEIYRLADTFDEMLDKIESTMENEKRFTSDASHELRTPVAVINSECEYVLDCADNIEEARESVAAIKRQSDKMSKLIDGLLTISRMDQKTQKLNFEETDISELLNFVCDEQEEINGGAASLKRSIAEDIRITADIMMLTRLFVNLLENAYRYGGDKIAVTLEERGENIVAAVGDNGMGISEEDLPKIWERFYQADRSRTNGSMGLGLSMVKQIADCHNGTVTVESETGKGTVFVVTLRKSPASPS